MRHLDGTDWAHDPPAAVTLFLNFVVYHVFPPFYLAIYSSLPHSQAYNEDDGAIYSLWVPGKAAGDGTQKKGLSNGQALCRECHEKVEGRK